MLESRAQALVGHPDSSVSGLAIETLTEIEIFNYSEASYGYVFYVLSEANLLPLSNFSRRVN